MKTERLIVGIVTIAALIAGGIFVAKKNYPTYELRCKNEMFQRKSIAGGQTLLLHTNYFILLYRDGTGSITHRGELVKGDDHFLVHRALPFSYTDTNNDGIYNLTRLKGVKYPDDNVPDALAKHFPYLLDAPTASTAPRYIQLTQLNNDLLLINELTIPYLLCQRF